MLPLYPYSGEAIITGNGFASILPNHGRAARLHRRVSIDAPAHVLGGDGLKSQTPRRKICNHLRLCSHGATWADANKILSIEAIEGRGISTNLRLNAFLIQLPQGRDGIALDSRCRRDAAGHQTCGKCQAE